LQLRDENWHLYPGGKNAAKWAPGIPRIVELRVDLTSVPVRGMELTVISVVVKIGLRKVWIDRETMQLYRYARPDEREDKVGIVEASAEGSATDRRVRLMSIGRLIDEELHDKLPDGAECCLGSKGFLIIEPVRSGKVEAAMVPNVTTKGKE
jgi:hypothetical protein